MAQVAHAAFMFAQDHGDKVAPWFRDSQYLIVVSVPDESALCALAARAGDLGIVKSRWHEPDLGGSLTALALAPGKDSRRLCANLPLAGKERKTH
jgi:peptidyl-tRNA hydrolase